MNLNFDPNSAEHSEQEEQIENRDFDNLNKSLIRLDSKFQEIYLSTLSISRTIILLELTSLAKNFRALPKERMIAVFVREPHAIFEFIDPMTAQFFSQKIKHLTVKTKDITPLFIDYIHSDSYHNDAFCFSVFPSLFSYFSTYDYTDAASILILDLMQKHVDMRIIHSMCRPFFHSMHSFYNALWYNFHLFLDNREDISNDHLFVMLRDAADLSNSLIEEPHQKVLMAIMQTQPIDEQVLFIDQVIIYDSAKKWLKFSPLFLRLPNDDILNYIHSISHAPVSSESVALASLVSTVHPATIGLPHLLDFGFFKHIPLLFSDYDALQILHLFNEVERPLFNSEERYTIENLKKNLFCPFHSIFYWNIPKSSHSEPDLNMINKHDIIKPFKKKETIFMQMKTNENVDIFNSLLSMDNQINLVQQHYIALQPIYFIELSRFFKGYFKDIENIVDSSIIQYKLIRLIKGIGYQESVVFPYITQLLNKVTPDFGKGVSKLRAKYGEMIRKLNQEHWLLDEIPINTESIFKTLLTMLINLKDLNIGDRLSQILEFFIMVSQIVLKCIDNNRNLMKFFAYLLVRSQEEYLMETLLYLDEVVFRDILLQQVTGYNIKKLWPALMQSFWFVTTNDQDLVIQCHSIRFLKQQK